MSALVLLLQTLHGSIEKAIFIASDRRQTPGWTPGFTPYKHALMQRNMPCRYSDTAIMGTICYHGWFS